MIAGLSIGGRALRAGARKGRTNLDKIREQPSETAKQVKHKEDLYKRFEAAREPFRQLSELWCSDYAAPKGKGISDAQYQSALQLVASPQKFKKLGDDEWFKEAIERARRPDFRSFTWELEFPEVFFTSEGPRPIAGFDAIIGNPPYDVLSELENESDLTAFRAVIADNPEFAASVRGKNNLYKLFVCKALSLLGHGGVIGFITPMPILGDDQAADLRREMVRVANFKAIEAFPQKDDPRNRVFPEAKLSTAVFILAKDKHLVGEEQAFPSRIHPGRFILEDSPGLSLTTSAIPLYDPLNFTIVSCDQSDWDLAVRIMASGRMQHLSEYATSYQGEVNETTGRNPKGSRKPHISYRETDGPEVIRGAHVCLYSLRAASQGRAVFLLVDSFLDRTGPNSDELKAFHHRYERVGFQRKSPQNNFRRLIAAPIPKNTFLLESVSDFPSHRCRLPLPFVLALLNSKLCEWYFRMGSCNAMVGEYQVNGLPCPVFADDAKVLVNDEQVSRWVTLIAGGSYDDAKATLRAEVENSPFSSHVLSVIVELANLIVTHEKSRGEIARVDRSQLAESAQPLQDMIDFLLFKMAGLADDEIVALEKRLAKML